MYICIYKVHRLSPKNIQTPNPFFSHMLPKQLSLHHRHSHLHVLSLLELFASCSICYSLIAAKDYSTIKSTELV